MDIGSLIELKPKPNIPQIRPGDTVKVSIKIREGDRERTQVFQGVVIRVRKGKANANFTVRRVTYGVGVEYTIFLHSPLLEKVEILQRGRVRRARLYYIRGLSSRASRAKIKARGKVKIEEPLVAEEQIEEPQAEEQPAAEQQIEEPQAEEQPAAEQQIEEPRAEEQPAAEQQIAEPQAEEQPAAEQQIAEPQETEQPAAEQQIAEPQETEQPEK